MLIYVLYTVFAIACLVLILAVLLQPGKADAGSLFTSSFSSTAFGPRGTQTLLAKITIGAAIVFMLLALMISMGVGGYRSVLSGAGDAPAAPAQQPAAPAAAPEGTEQQQPAAGTEQPAASPAETTASPAAAPAAQPAAATTASPSAAR